MYSSPPTSSDTQAAYSRSPGCLRRFLIPVLAALLTSSLLVVGLSKIEIVQAESPALVPVKSSESQTILSSVFTPEVQYWGEEIINWAETYQLDPNLVATVMQIESCGYVMAESGAGAKGLFQVMPYHFQEGENPFQPNINAKRGLQYLRQAKEAGGNSRMALAGMPIYPSVLVSVRFAQPKNPPKWPSAIRQMQVDKCKIKFLIQHDHCLFEGRGFAKHIVHNILLGENVLNRCPKQLPRGRQIVHNQYSCLLRRHCVSTGSAMLVRKPFGSRSPKSKLPPSAASRVLILPRPLP